MLKSHSLFNYLSHAGELALVGHLGIGGLTNSVYLALRQSWSNAPVLEAPDKPRWTEPPRAGGHGVLLEECKVQAGVLGSPGGYAMVLGQLNCGGGVASGVTTGAARPNGEGARCGLAPQDEASPAEVVGERQRDGR